MAPPPNRLQRALDGKWHCWGCSAPSAPVFGVDPGEETRIAAIVFEQREGGYTERFFLHIQPDHYLLVLESMSPEMAASAYSILSSKDTPRVCVTEEQENLYDAFSEYQQLHPNGFLLTHNDVEVPVAPGMTKKQVYECYHFRNCMGPSRIVPFQDPTLKALPLTTPVRNLSGEAVRALTQAMVERYTRIEELAEELCVDWRAVQANIPFRPSSDPTSDNIVFKPSEDPLELSVALLIVLYHDPSMTLLRLADALLL